MMLRLAFRMKLVVQAWMYQIRFSNSPYAKNPPAREKIDGNLLQITPHPTQLELGFVVIFVSYHLFFLSQGDFLRKVSF